tara:strand:+ start:10671 stop:11594 length:924 start_codon:yes stop_codon:yes gene_type:complete
LLRIENVSKSYGNQQALKEVSISIPKGSICGLLGPNGAGKTTLIRILNQIILPDSGKVYLDGALLEPKHISTIGYLPEERGLYKNMKVGEQALYLAQLKGLSKGEATNRLRYWFDKFDISDWWHKKTQELSKGMAQKIQFIVTVLHRPKLLIFDEPFSGFDPVNAALMAKEILQLRDEGATVIFSTHRMESVEEMCDHIVLLHQSKKVLEGSLASLQNKFQSGVFEIGLQTNDKKKVRALLSSQFDISEAHFQTMQDELKFQLQWDPDKSSNELIQVLQAYGEISHFVAAIPTVNAIFMKAVNGKIE